MQKGTALAVLFWGPPRSLKADLIRPFSMIIGPYVNCPSIQSTAVQLVFNPFSQLVPQLELYSQLQLSLWSDPIAFSVPKPT